MPSDNPDETYEFVGPTDDGWYRTQIPDWIALHPQLKDGAYRLFTIVRSLILEKRAKVRLLALDQLAFLMVGKNGKPVGSSTIKDLLANLHDIGLMENPDGTRLVTSTGHKGIQSRRRYKLNDWPADKSSYLGWRNTWDKLDAYTPDWRTTRTDVYAGQISGRKTVQRDDQQQQDSPKDSAPPENAPTPPAQTEEPAGQLNGRKSGRGGRKSASRGRKSVRHSGATSNDAVPLKDSPEGASSSSGSEEEELPSAETQTPSATASDVMHRTNATAEEAEAVLDAIEADAEQRSVKVGRLRRYVASFDDRDLSRHLRKIRAQRAPQSQTGAPEATGSDAVCGEHHEPVPCEACAGLPLALIRPLLRRFGPIRRPDLAARVNPAPATA